MKSHVAFVLIYIGFNGIANGQYRITNRPDSSNIITTDINHFWQAFDLLQHQKTSADSLTVIKTIFLDQASEGLSKYLQAASLNEKGYLETIRKRKADYLAIRTKTEAIADKKHLIVQYLTKFKQLYPALKIPAICFSLGKFEVGGTQFDNALYIGCEVDILNHIDIQLQSIHELAHFQQKNQNPVSNLDLAMIEGGAEFISYQVTGKRTIPATWKYGIAHETSLWQEFQSATDSAIDMKWFSDMRDTNKNRPGSLAYFLGFQICEAYLKKHQDKKQALKELVEMENPKEIFSESLYK